MNIYELETPALCVDYELLMENIRLMGLNLKGSDAHLRPHFKTCKTLEIVKLQMANGAKGITCSKLGEAEVLASAGVPDILIANQIVQPSKITRLAELAAQTRLTVCVDDEENILALSRAAKAAGSTIHVYVEYDIGMNRCGVSDAESFLRLASLVSRSDNLTFDGIQAYAGQLSHEANAEYKAAAAAKAVDTLRRLKDYAESRGISVREISGGSTNTSALKAASRLYTEIQAGSYVFMDAAFKDCQLPFHSSLAIVSTVISKRPSHIVLDCGAKCLGLDQCGPIFRGYEAKKYKLSEEHAAIYGENLPVRVNSKILLTPGHCCTTVNLFDSIYVVKGEEVVGKWAVEGRGKSV